MQVTAAPSASRASEQSSQLRRKQDAVTWQVTWHAAAAAAAAAAGDAVKEPCREHCAVATCHLLGALVAIGAIAECTLWKVLLWGSAMLGRRLNLPLRLRITRRGGPAQDRNSHHIKLLGKLLRLQPLSQGTGCHGALIHLSCTQHGEVNLLLRLHVTRCEGACTGHACIKLLAEVLRLQSCELDAGPSWQLISLPACTPDGLSLPLRLRSLLAMVSTRRTTSRSQPCRPDLMNVPLYTLRFSHHRSTCQVPAHQAGDAGKNTTSGLTGAVLVSSHDGSQCAIPLGEQPGCAAPGAALAVSSGPAREKDRLQHRAHSSGACGQSWWRPVHGSPWRCLADFAVPAAAACRPQPARWGRRAGPAAAAGLASTPCTALHPETCTSSGVPECPGNQAALQLAQTGEKSSVACCVGYAGPSCKQ